MSCRELRLRLSGIAVGVITAFACGCGSGDLATETAGSASPNGADPLTPPVAAIGEIPDNKSTATSLIAVEPGSPEAILLEITRIIAAVNEDVQADVSGESDATFADVAPAIEETVLAKRRQQLEQIVDLSTQVVAATHLKPEAEQSFNNAVHYLSDARLELATMGDTSQAQLLIDDADSLYERDKTSFAAAEAGFKVVQLAERMAHRLGRDDADWLGEYATQAINYAERFPTEESRAAMGLFTAGRLCDRFGEVEAARRCLNYVQSHFADTIFAEQSAGILRRLSLTGNPVPLSGPTIDGGFLELEQYRGRTILVVFWSTTSPTFQEQLPLIQQVESELSGAGLTIIGVNLDQDEVAVDQFLVQHELSWPQIFSPDTSQRGGRNPVARYFGMQIVPSYWLIDRSGVARHVPIAAGELTEQARQLVNAR